MDSNLDGQLLEKYTDNMERPIPSQAFYPCRAREDGRNVEYVHWGKVLGLYVGANLTDESPTLDVDEGSLRVLKQGTLTTNRSATLDDDNPTDGEILQIDRLDTTAYTYAIVNGGSGGGTLYTFPASEARSAKFKFDGTDWALVEHWRRS